MAYRDKDVKDQLDYYAEYLKSLSSEDIAYLVESNPQEYDLTAIPLDEIKPLAEAADKWIKLYPENDEDTDASRAAREILTELYCKI